MKLRYSLLSIFAFWPMAISATHAQSVDERDVFIFQQFDASRDSRIDIDEFLALGRLTFVSVDRDKNGSVSDEEFWAIAQGNNEAAKAEAFRSLDANGDGQMSLPEFEESQSERFTKADANGDGFLTFSEYKGL